VLRKLTESLAFRRPLFITGRRNLVVKEHRSFDDYRNWKLKIPGAIHLLESYRCSKYRAVSLVGISRSYFYYQPHPRDDRAERARIKEIVEVLYLGIQNTSTKRTMAIHDWNWNLTLSQLDIFFEGRLDGALDR